MKLVNSIKSQFQKNKLRAVGITAAVVLGVGGLAGAATSALFTSTDTASAFSNNGHVELSVTEKLSVGNVLPGVPRSAPITFDNSKSTAPVKMAISAVSAPSVKNPAGADFSEFTVRIVDSAGKTVYGPVAANALSTGAIDVVIAEGHTWTGSVIWELAVDAGNQYQDINVHYSSVSFTGTQVVPGS